MFMGVEDLQLLGRSRVEAATLSAAAVSRGVQRIAEEASAYAKRSIEDGSTATSRLMGASSLDGAVRVQADYAEAAFEGLVAQAGRMGALMAAVGRDAAEPSEGVMPFGLRGEAGGR